VAVGGAVEGVDLFADGPADRALLADVAGDWAERPSPG
jgi:hypothetical protein